jgi:pyrroline-5-carboxylate reductase
MNKIAFIGAGSMAEAIISGLIHAGIYEPKQIIVTNHSNKARLAELEEKYHILTTDDKEFLVNTADMIVLAMKPKDVYAGVSSIRDYMKNQLIISLLAGISIKTIQQILGKEMPIIRAMPNTSATIKLSATGIAASENVTMNQVKCAKNLFETIGIATLVDEGQLDAVTGLSGSGPAYIYYLVEAMELAAKEIGLEEAVAKPLILQTIAGAAEMLSKTDKQASQLRKEVTSPGGTTEAGLNKLVEKNFQDAIVSCIKRATERSQELNKMYSYEIVKEKAKN